EYVENGGLCSVLAVLMHYFYLTNFFWMFVEGLYLFLLVVATFTGEKVKLQIYIIIGWGIPGVIVVTWAIIKHLGKTAPDNAASTDCKSIS
ncbi:Diuretic hormone receptor, partial [Gryllus bimaculatus]